MVGRGLIRGGRQQHLPGPVQYSAEPCTIPRVKPAQCSQLQASAVQWEGTTAAPNSAPWPNLHAALDHCAECGAGGEDPHRPVHADAAAGACQAPGPPQHCAGENPIMGAPEFWRCFAFSIFQKMEDDLRNTLCIAHCSDQTSYNTIQKQSDRSRQQPIESF